MKEKLKKHSICVWVIFVLIIIICILVYFLLSNKRKYINPYKIKVDPMDNFVFLGDSITDFYPLEEYYDNIPVINSGIAGNTTTDILNDMEKRVYQYNPTKVILLIGTNDLLEDSDKSEENVYKNIKKIVSLIKQNRKKAKVYIESIYPINHSVNESMVGTRNQDRIIRINKKLKNYCEEENCTFIDMYSHLVNEKGMLKEKYTDDGLHLNSLGYITVTRELIPFLNN